MGVQSLGQEDPLEKEMATHSSIRAWKVPCTEEPDGLLVHGITKSQDTSEQLGIGPQAHIGIRGAGESAWSRESRKNKSL